VAQPMTIELVVYHKTAKRVAVAIAPNPLARATKLIK
jgi:hypothetical protein